MGYILQLHIHHFYLTLRVKLKSGVFSNPKIGHITFYPETFHVCLSSLPSDNTSHLTSLLSHVQNRIGFLSSITALATFFITSYKNNTWHSAVKSEWLNTNTFISGKNLVLSKLHNATALDSNTCSMYDTKLALTDMSCQSFSRFGKSCLI